MLLEHGAGERVNFAELVNLVAPQLDAVGGVNVGGIDLDGVAPDAERPTPQVFAALVLNLDQLLDDVFAAHTPALFQQQQHAVVGLGRTETINATDAGDNYAVAPLEERAGGRQPEFVEFVVDGCFLFNVGVAAGEVGFRLVVVVITDKVLDGVFRKEPSKLMEELRGQGLVMGQHQGWPSRLLDDLGHGVGLARTGHAEEHLMLLAVCEAAGERVNGGLLVALRLVVADQLKVHRHSRFTASAQTFYYTRKAGEKNLG